MPLQLPDFLQEAQIWYDRNLDQRSRPDQFENVIGLTDEFYREIRSHPIPTDLEVVKVLAVAPAALYLFKCNKGWRRGGD